MTKGKLLLTSSGITNDNIQQALVDLLGKPIREASALFVPTATYAYPVGITHSWQVIKGPDELGWKALGVLDWKMSPNGRCHLRGCLFCARHVGGLYALEG